MGILNDPKQDLHNRWVAAHEIALPILTRLTPPLDLWKTARPKFLSLAF